MPRQGQPRPANYEANLAERIRLERTDSQMTYEGLAEKMAEVGCPVPPSALHRIEKGSPPRRIAVDELMAFSKVFRTSIEDLLRPPELLRQERAQELVAKLHETDEQLAALILAMIDAHTELAGLAVDDDELHEYVVNHWSQRVAEAPKRFRGTSLAVRQSLMRLYDEISAMAEGIAANQRGRSV